MKKIPTDRCRSVRLEPSRNRPQTLIRQSGGSELTPQIVLVTGQTENVSPLELTASDETKYLLRPGLDVQNTSERNF